MATIRFKGLAEYQAKLSQLSALAEERVLGPAVYDGAAVVMEAVKEELRAVPTDDRRFVPAASGLLRHGPTTEQREQLLESYGIAPMQVDDKGFLNVKVGVGADYNTIKSKRWPKGQPNLMVARAIESGTSFMEAHPFVKEAVRKSRKAAEDVMARRVDKEIDEIMK